MKDVEKRDYLGARGTRFGIFPGSSLFKKQPPFVMAAELVETGRLWGRMNARIEPEWCEEMAGHLVKRSYSEPHWEKNRGAVTALEKVTLYGVPIVSERPINYGKIDREAARELFVRHALVQGEWRTHHQFFADNQALLDEAEALEHRARRRDIVVDDETLFDFYDVRIPADVVSTAHFDSWWKKARHDTPDLLTFSLDMLVHETADEVSSGDFPDVWRYGDATLPLDYQFEPGSEADGVTVDIPVATLTQVSAEDFSWPVPGLRQELVVALLRSLPKSLRVNFVPAPNHAREFLSSVSPGEEPLLDSLERHLRRTTGVVVPRDAWDLDKVPPHLRLSFRVVGDDGGVLGESKDLNALRTSLRSAAGDSIALAASDVERTGMTGWDIGELPQTYVQTRAGHEVRGYPALHDEGETVGVRVFSTADEQAAAMRAGTRRLLMLTTRSPAPILLAELSNTEKLTLGLAPHPTVPALLEDCYGCAVDAVVAKHGGPAWDQAGFEALVEQVRVEGTDRARDVMGIVQRVLTAGQEVNRRLSGRAELALLPALSDLKGQWERLLHPGFVAEAGIDALRHYPRYLAAMGVRLDKLQADPRRDAVLMGSVAGVQASYLNRLAALPAGQPASQELQNVRWMIEELRVSLWAQELKTAQPVSVQRVEKALREL